MGLLIICMLISFLTTYFITPATMKYLKLAGVVGIDHHKRNKPVLPSSGGLCVASGVLAGLLTYIGLNTFLYHSFSTTIYFLAAISTILIVMLVGLIDDLNVKLRKKMIKGWKERVGIPQWVKPLLTLPAAVPLMVIAAGNTTMSIPFFGSVNFGILYPLILVPIGVVGASNVVNLLGGFNGSEAGMGLVYTLSLGIYGLLHQSLGSVVLLFTFSSLLGFIKYNWYPAKILPGDSLTYLLGSIVATSVIIGNMEKAGVIVLIPFIIEFFLKLRSKFKASCLGKLEKDGKLKAPYGKKVYSLTHLIMCLGKFSEKEITYILILMEVVVCAFLFLYSF